ncbi:MAG: hypothetical protein D6708_16400, partial [Candidatus Dadabacteria bacterium]
GSSIARPDPERLERAAAEFLETLRNEDGTLAGIDRTTALRLLAGILRQLRVRGGILLDVLEGYVEARGNPYPLSKIPWMPWVSARRSRPRFVSRKGTAGFDALTKPGPRNRTWYDDWAERLLVPVHPLVAERVGWVLETAMQALARAGLVDHRRVGNDTVWGIGPGALRVEAGAAQFRCTRCGHAVSAARTEADLWDGMPCQKHRCAGAYAREPDRPDYYAKLYRSGDVVRIFTEEHTGLLSREAREAVEGRFKARGPERRPWDPNVLSCTPTLEMGIDIGDLSTVLLCSVPPSQASYVQRVGRAGRRDGNSLALTVANGRPHDLYFYADPLEMIAGRVEAPGVYLDAAAVLERQFTAYCMDRWVRQGLPPDAVPRTVGQILDHLGEENPARFPHNLLRFIETHETELFDEFVALFAGELSEGSVEALRA